MLIARTTALDGPLLIGPRSALAHNTSVHQSTLGADCTIGPNTTVSLSYVFDDVRIGASCTLQECMIGRGVEIRDGVKIGKGVLIGNGVSLGRGIVVPDFARVGRERYRPDNLDEEDEDEETEEERGGLICSQKKPLKMFSSTSRSAWIRLDRIPLAARRRRNVRRSRRRG